MTAKEIGDRQAFPPGIANDPSTGANYHTSGMTYRQWLIGMAMNGYLSNPKFDNLSYDIIAVRSILCAEAQLDTLSGET